MHLHPSTAVINGVSKSVLLRPPDTDMLKKNHTDAPGVLGVFRKHSKEGKHSRHQMLGVLPRFSHSTAAQACGQDHLPGCRAQGAEAGGCAQAAGPEQRRAGSSQRPPWPVLAGQRTSSLCRPEGSFKLALSLLCRPPLPCQQPVTLQSAAGHSQLTDLT